MKAIKRFVYLGYYVKNLDVKKFKEYLNYVSANYQKSKILLVIDSIFCVFKYNISLLEYFEFRFFTKTATERENWAGTGFMYEYQLLMNPLKERQVLNDKTQFYKTYQTFFKHIVADKTELMQNPKLWDKLVAYGAEKIVLKTKDGKCGKGVSIYNLNEFNGAKSLVDYMEVHNLDIAEEFIVQHEDLNKLSPSAVNTVRIFTQLDNKDNVVILGCRLRISLNSHIDNMAAGNLAAEINEHTGIIELEAVYSHIAKPKEKIHPITQMPIVGFKIPFWNEIILLVKNAALLSTKNKSIGWDIVVTPNGPGLLEGNHDWCKLVWQLPVNKGMKP